MIAHSRLCLNHEAIMQYEKTGYSKPTRPRCSNRTLQITRLRQAFGLTLQQAALLAALVYGEASE
jgi:hypothetical protein